MQHRTYVLVSTLVLCVLACAFRAKLGLHGTDLYGHDVFVPLDGAWRMLWGQRPHLDFYTPFGLGTYLPTLVGLKLSGGQVSGFGLGQGITGLLLTLWAYFLGRTRLSVWPLALFCFLVCFTAISVANMGQPTLSFTPGMTYNRHCYALVMLMILEAVIPPLKPVGKEWPSGASTGIVLSLLLFTKISFFMLAAALLGIMALCRPQTRTRWLGISAGLFGVSLIFASYFHFDLRPMLHDLAIAARAKRIHVRFYLWDNIAENAAACALLGIGAWLSLRDRALALAGIAVGGVGTAFILTNYEPSGFPLLAVLGVIVFNKIDPGRRKPLVMLLLCSVLPAITDVASAGVGLLYAASRLGKECMYYEGEQMAGAAGCYSDCEYVNIVNDGYRLIRDHSSADDTVLSLDFSNPFPFALRLRPMKGGTNNQQFSTTFSNQSFPLSERIFGNATLVIVPKRYTDDSLEGTVEAIYGAYLHANFSQDSTSKHWVLYRRNGRQT